MYFFNDFHRHVMSPSTFQNEMSSIKAEYYVLRSTIRFKSKSVVKFDRLINIMNYFCELSIDLCSIDMLKLRNGSAIMSNVNAGCQLLDVHLVFLVLLQPIMCFSLLALSLNCKKYVFKIWYRIKKYCWISKLGYAKARQSMGCENKPYFCLLPK